MTETPILNALLHPPLGLLSRSIIPGTFTGAGDIDRPAGPIGVNAFGLTFDLLTVPAGWGRVEGFPDVWLPRLVQLATVHRGADGHDLISEYHDFYAEGLYWLWENPFPQYVHYEVSPGVELVFFWILI